MACFKIRTTAFTKVSRYTLKMIKLNTKDQMIAARTIGDKLEKYISKTIDR